MTEKPYGEVLDEMDHQAKYQPATSAPAGSLRKALEAVQHWDEHESNPAGYGGLPRRIRNIVDAALDSDAACAALSLTSQDRGRP